MSSQSVEGGYQKKKQSSSDQRNSIPVLKYLCPKREEISTGSNESINKSFSKGMSNRKKRDQSLSSSLTSVCIAFSFCYVPLVITQCMSTSRYISLTKFPLDFDRNINNLFNISMFFASRLVMANSFLNGIIYSCKDKGFLLAAKTTVFKINTAKSKLLSSSQFSKTFSSRFSVNPV